MPSMDELIALVGEPLDGPAVRAFLEAQGLGQEKLHDRYQPERALSSKQQGYEVQYKKGRKGRPARIEVVFLYLTAKDEFSPFRGPLSAGLSPKDGRAEV